MFERLRRLIEDIATTIAAFWWRCFKWILSTISPLLLTLMSVAGPSVAGIPLSRPLLTLASTVTTTHSWISNAKATLTEKSLNFSSDRILCRLFGSATERPPVAETALDNTTNPKKSHQPLISLESVAHPIDTGKALTRRFLALGTRKPPILQPINNEKPSISPTVTSTSPTASALEKSLGSQSLNSESNTKQSIIEQPLNRQLLTSVLNPFVTEKLPVNQPSTSPSGLSSSDEKSRCRAFLNLASKARPSFTKKKLTHQLLEQASDTDKFIHQSPTLESQTFDLQPVSRPSDIAASFTPQSLESSSVTSPSEIDKSVSHHSLAPSSVTDPSDIDKSHPHQTPESSSETDGSLTFKPSNGKKSRRKAFLACPSVTAKSIVSQASSTANERIPNVLRPALFKKRN